MEDHEYLKYCKRSDDCIASIDLTNASFSIPLHKDSEKFFKFSNPNVINII